MKIMKAKLTVISIILSMLLFCINFNPIKTFKKLNRIMLNRPIKSEFIQLDRATTYNPVASQCDSNPLTTADGSLIDLSKLKDRSLRWVALSRDFIARWGGLEKIKLEVDHIDGDKYNNSRENLRLLCPNCHSTTPTWRKPKQR